MKRKKNSVYAGLAFGVIMSVYYAFTFDILQGIIGGVISGTLFGLFSYFFLNSKRIARQTQMEIDENDVLVLADDANRFVRIEATGGKLYLFTDRLQFKSHKVNIQKNQVIINLLEIEKVGFFNIYGFVPTGLRVTTKDGKSEKFVVNERKKWKAKIEKLLSEK
ncbi:MAG: hypothetical protein LBT50_04480 [Prevotellaceae bacterium]|jgi:hypothetical protein|nr:hypothetical protein [Prevotellaceae bacterium]